MAVATRRDHGACYPVVHTTSAKDGTGIAELKEAIAELMFGEV